MIFSLSRTDMISRLDELADVLEDCVNGGASVSFMQPFSRDTASAFWHNVARSVAEDERVVFAVEDDSGRIVGTVQLITAQPENQPHRAEVAKLLVHQRGRRKGIARELMAHLEQVARQRGKSLLVLDTASGSGAETFYVQCGWQKVGEIPRFAMMPDGQYCATSLFYKFV